MARGRRLALLLWLAPCFFVGARIGEAKHPGLLYDFDDALLTAAETNSTVGAANMEGYNVVVGPQVIKDECVVAPKHSIEGRTV